MRGGELIEQFSTSEALSSFDIVDGVTCYFFEGSNGGYFLLILSEETIIAPEDCSEMFPLPYCENVYLKNFDTSNTKNMSSMFATCGVDALSSPRIIMDINTSKVTNMTQMFANSDIAALDLSSFIFSNSCITSNMFSGCGTLHAIIVNKATFENQSWKAGSALDDSVELIVPGIDYSKFNNMNMEISALGGYFETKGVSKIVFDTFQESGNYVDENGYQVVTNYSTLTHFPGTLDQMTFYMPLSTVECVSYYMYSSYIYYKHSICICPIMHTAYDCIFYILSDAPINILGDSETVKESGNGMFEDCQARSIILRNINTSGLKTFYRMFYGSLIEKIDISELDTTNIQDVTDMFSLCNLLSTIIVGDNWKLNNLQNPLSSYVMFDSCGELIGSNKTPWSEDHITAEYAHIDGEGGPGYFTRK